MDNTLKDAQNPSGPVSVNSMKITIDRDLCIGAATCLAIAPEVFVLDNEAKAVILSTADNADDATILDAARGCPTAAITLEDKDGQKVYPK